MYSYARLVSNRANALIEFRESRPLKRARVH
jgi:hypothetical protein